MSAAGRCVFLDVDTQIDFLFPAGALYVPGAERLIKRIGALNHWAAEREIPVVSTVCAHGENDPEFRDWPPHCVTGTVGQQKPALLRLDRCIQAPGPDSLKGARQILFAKQTVNLFENPHWQGVFEQLGGVSVDWVVYGVVTEICVAHAVRGLLKRGVTPIVVIDAVQGLSSDAAAVCLAEWRQRGCRLTQATALLSG